MTVHASRSRSRFVLASFSLRTANKSARAAANFDKLPRAQCKTKSARKSRCSFAYLGFDPGENGALPSLRCILDFGSQKAIAFFGRSRCLENISVLSLLGFPTVWHKDLQYVAGFFLALEKRRLHTAHGGVNAVEASRPPTRCSPQRYSRKLHRFFFFLCLRRIQSSPKDNHAIETFRKRPRSHHGTPLALSPQGASALPARSALILKASG